MEFRWRNSAVAIVSHKKSSGEREGTGTLVSSNLVLTARHVVFHEDAIGPVRMRWQSEESAYSASSGDENNGYHNAIENDPGDRGIVWSDSELDLALIRCHPPSDISPVPVQPAEPRSRINWAAEAFPRVGEKHWEQSATLSGSAVGCQGHGKKVRFSLKGQEEIKTLFREEPPLEEKKNLASWSGASGAAVVDLAHAPERIVGVIVTESRFYETSFNAVPISEALKIDGFRMLIAPSDSNHQKCIKQMESCLSQLMAIPIGKQLLNRWLGTKLYGKQDTILDARELVQMPVEDSINAVADVYDNAELHPEIRVLALRLACAIATVAVDQSLTSEVDMGSERLVRTESGTLMGVEIGMARFDGRLPEFVDRQNEGDLPRGRYSLELQPEQGCGEQRIEVHNDLARRLGTDLLEAVGEVTQSPAPTSFLKTQKRRGKPSYYLPVAVADPEDLERWKSAARDLDLPHVSIATYHPEENDAVERDEMSYGALRTMLPLKSKPENSDG